MRIISPRRASQPRRTRLAALVCATACVGLGGTAMAQVVVGPIPLVTGPQADEGAASGARFFGHWSVTVPSATTSVAQADGDINFPLLRRVPTPHYVPRGETVPSCPGTPSAPSAAKGHLCIYESYATNIKTVVSQSANGYSNAADRFGAELWTVSADATRTGRASGSWAVTAP